MNRIRPTGSRPRLEVGRDFFVVVPRAGILRAWKACVAPPDPPDEEDRGEPAPLLPV